MRRSIRTPLALAAVTAATAVALVAPATAAGAATTPTPNPGDAKALIANPPTTVVPWGPYYSSNFKARAAGTVRVHWNPSHTLNAIRVQGKLWDLDFRTLQQGGKCAYVQFRVHHLYAPNWSWQNAPSYKLCNAGDYRKIDFRRYNVEKLRVRVSQIGKYSNQVVRKGAWHTVSF